MAQKIQFNPTQDFGALYDADQQKAQERYKAGLLGGYSEEDADKIYLAPFRTKWDIIKAAPATFQNKANLDKINSDFDTAQQTVLKNLTRGVPTEDTVMKHLAPVVQRWGVVATLPPPQANVPRTPGQIAAWYARNPAMQAEEKQTLQQIQSGVPESEAILAHPTLLQNTPFSSRWNPRFTSALNRDQRSEAKAEQPPNIPRLARSRKFFAGELVSNPNLPDDVKQEYQSQIENIDAQLSPFPKGVRFSPQPSEDQPAEPVPSGGPPKELPLIGTKEEYDALASGDQYYDSVGNLRRKK